MKQRKKNVGMMGKYSLCYAVMFALCYAVLLISGRMPIWVIDGKMQHYPFLVYVGQWLRGLFTGESGMYDFALGFGEDVLSAVNYYGFGDPLALLMGLFQGQATEWGYVLLIAIKGWLAGLACMALARKLKFDAKQTFVSGLLYAFSLGIFSMASTRHAMFVNPYIHLPLILLGMEYVFENKKPWLLSLAIALSALYGFYFLYVNSLLLLIYALVRQMSRGIEKPLKTLPKTALRAIGWYVLGIGLAAAVLLPVLYGFFGAQRAQSSLSLSDFRWHYSLATYLKYPMVLLTSESSGAVPFMPAVCVIGAGLMFARAKEYRRWLPMIAVALIMTLIPATGLVMNGFSYEVSRWAYANDLLVALIGGMMLPQLTTVNRRERCWLKALCALLIAYAAWMTLRKGVHLEMLAAVAIAILTVLLTRNDKHPIAVRRILAGLTVCSIVAAHVGMTMDVISEMSKNGESWAALDESTFANLPQMEDFGRTDSNFQSVSVFNDTAVAGVASTSVYNSLISNTYHGFLQDVACTGLLQTNAISGLDGRAALEALWSVGRFVKTEDAQCCVPYGFEETEEGVWENQYALPIGYAFTSTVSEADYAEMSPLEKQWALLQGAVTDEASALPQIQAEQSLQLIEIESISMENIEVSGTTLEVKKDAVIRLSYQAPADCELYLQLDGLAFPDGKIDLNNQMRIQSGANETTALLVREGIAQDLNREFYLVNLGYDANERATAEIRFTREGTYRLAEIRMYAQPMSDFAQRIEKLQKRSLQNVEVQTDCVRGTVEMDAPGVMQFSIPYSTGWTIRIDEEKAQPLYTAETFLAVELTEGAHAIELTYRTPMLYEGIACSVISALILIIMIQRKEQKQ